jgi:hypothetical protein
MPRTIEERLGRGPATSNELQAACGMNQIAVSRAIRALGRRVVSTRRGRTPVYALSCPAFGDDDRQPLWQVNPHGDFDRIAFLHPLAHGGFCIEPETGMPEVLLGEGGDGWYDDLPFFLEDLRPQGFLGRQIAGELAQRTPDLAPDPRRWTSEQVGRFLLANGDDLPGNLLLGHRADWRVRRRPPAVLENQYPALADAVLSGEIPGSSAGGEQPKFTAYHAEHGHVIVKFSPAGADPVAVRWRDLLVTEHQAAEAIHAAGLPAAETRLIETGGRLFLESRRFDRSGPLGRLSLISLQAVDAEFAGLGPTGHG